MALCTRDHVKDSEMGRLSAVIQGDLSYESLHQRQQDDRERRCDDQAVVMKLEEGAAG